jgi:Arc/MetJ-type ribon-helix-helix transcriptional regulator
MNQKGFSIRLPEDQINQIDALVEKGKYTTRNDFIKRAVSWLLNQEDYRKMQREELLLLLKNDSEIQSALRLELSRAITEKFQK